MHEFTLGGAWFRWSAFDKASRLLAAYAMGFGAIAGLLIGMSAKPRNDRFGFDVTAIAPSLALIGVIVAALAAWLWHRFSLRQDEMFNQVQNWTLGMAGAWTCVTCAAWNVMTISSLAEIMPATAPPFLFAGATLAFWIVGVRKWA